MTIDLIVLDALRGLAAMYVMLGHARWLLWTGNAAYVASGERGLGWALASLSASLRYGHQAVLLFFLLSGFCIHFRQAAAITSSERSGRPKSSFAVRVFAWHRMRRLHPPLALALVLTALFDVAGGRINPGFYAGMTAYPLINSNIGGQSLGFESLIGGLLFQSGFLVGQFGTNGPLWSLAYEFWFYVLYPVVLVLSTRFGPSGIIKVTGSVAIAALVLGASVGGWVPWWVFSVLTLWIVWAIGAVLAEVYVGRARVPGLNALLPLALVGLVALAFGQPVQVSETARDVLWGLVLGVLLASVLFAVPSDGMKNGINHAALRIAPLGRVSYTLYIIHFPWLALVSAWWLSFHTELPGGAELAVPGAVSALALAWLAWYLVERHFVSASGDLRIRGAQPGPSLLPAGTST